MHKLICIVGETASGKDTLVKSVIDKYNLQLKKVVSYTTRPIRETETDGVEHYFTTDEKYDKIKKENVVVAETQIGNYRYMSTYEECIKSDVYIIDPNGIRYLENIIQIKDLDIEIIKVYIYTPLEERKFRAKMSRSDFDKEFLARVNSESEQFNDFRNNKLYDHIIFNSADYGFDHSVDQLFMILEYEKIM